MFHFDSQKEGSAFASDMENRHLQRIYDDACDIGFAVKSSVTGVVVVYVMTEVKRDRENDITHWEYVPTSESIRKNPRCQGSKISVWND